MPQGTNESNYTSGTCEFYIGFIVPTSPTTFSELCMEMCNQNWIFSFPTYDTGLKKSWVNQTSHDFNS